MAFAFIRPPTPRRFGAHLEFMRLAIDYVVHYVKAHGGTAPKVFKLRELALAPRATVKLTKSQAIRDFTTRRHHPGRHRVEIQINGRIHAGADFMLLRA